MLLVKTTIAQSPIHGIGCFAAEGISKGTAVWRYDASIDTLHTEEQLLALAPACQAQIRKYAYFDRHFIAFLLCGDDARFFNSSATPNCLDPSPTLTSAARDIEIGEELTSDYSAFMAPTQLS
jgi:uncharacterized protein